MKLSEDPIIIWSLRIIAIVFALLVVLVGIGFVYGFISAMLGG